MNSGPSSVERRAAQRFDVHLPITVKLAEHSSEGQGFTQDLSARGVFFYTDFPLSEGAAVECTLTMPSEITLAESMPVRCRGKVTRIVAANANSKTGVAVHIEGYEYLPKAAPVTEVSTHWSDAYANEQPEDTAVSAHTFDFRSSTV